MKPPNGSTAGRRAAGAIKPVRPKRPGDRDRGGLRTIVGRCRGAMVTCHSGASAVAAQLAPWAGGAAALRPRASHPIGSTGITSSASATSATQPRQRLVPNAQAWARHGQGWAAATTGFFQAAANTNFGGGNSAASAWAAAATAAVTSAQNGGDGNRGSGNVGASAPPTPVPSAWGQRKSALPVSCSLDNNGRANLRQQP